MDTVSTLLNLLRTNGKTISCAESITGGHLQALLTSVSGASDVFTGGITAYRRSVKVRALGVDDTLAAKTNCVDEEIARQMARGALKRFAADYAIATCGYAERADGAPHAFIAVAAARGVLFSGRIELSGGRVEAQEQAARTALATCVELLRGELGEGAQ